MSTTTGVTALLDDLARLTRGQWALRLVPVPALAAFLLLVSAAGGRLPLLAVLVAAVLAAGAVVLPDSGAALGLVLVLVGLWLFAVPEQLGGWTLLGALDLLVLHVGVTLAGYDPPGAAPDRAWLVLWGRRSAALAPVALLALLVARFAAEPGPAAGGAATAAGLAVLLPWVAYLGVRLAGPDRG